MRWSHVEIGAFGDEATRNRTRQFGVWRRRAAAFAKENMANNSALRLPVGRLRSGAILDANWRSSRTFRAEAGPRIVCRANDFLGGVICKQFGDITAAIRLRCG